MTFSIQRHAKSIGLILKTGRGLQLIDAYIQLIIINQDLITGEVTFTDKVYFGKGKLQRVKSVKMTVP